MALIFLLSGGARSGVLGLSGGGARRMFSARHLSSQLLTPGTLETEYNEDNQGQQATASSSGEDVDEVSEFFRVLEDCSYVI